MKVKMKPDFQGWATIHGVECSDGLTIAPEAFAHQDGDKVPLMWEHEKDLEDCVGHIIFEHYDEGMFSNLFMNNTERGLLAKQLLNDGSIDSLSINAKGVKDEHNVVRHGRIKEVSLVIAGANPGAKIIQLNHSDNDDNFEMQMSMVHFDCEKGVERMIDIKHSDAQSKPKPFMHADAKNEGSKTLGDIINTMNDEQLDAAIMLAIQAAGTTEEQIKQSFGGEGMRENAFDKMKGTMVNINHKEIAKIVAKYDSLKEAMTEIKIEHGIDNIEQLFPDAHRLDNEPKTYMDKWLKTDEIMSKVGRTPFGRVRVDIADFSDSTLRAKGYIKGNEKVGEVVKILKRTNEPKTIIKYEEIDRDDTLDLRQFDYAAFMKPKMKMLLKQELIKAIFLSDGRPDLNGDGSLNKDKIDENLIIPIVKDHDLFTIKATAAKPENLFESIMNAMLQYQGTGMPDVYIHPANIVSLLLLKDADDRYMFDSVDALKKRMGVVGDIIQTSMMPANTVVVVNLNDYKIGTDPGGDATMFDDFDIKYNLFQFLIETRCSGMLTIPKSAIAITITTPASAPTIAAFPDESDLTKAGRTPTVTP